MNEVLPLDPINNYLVLGQVIARYRKGNETPYELMLIKIADVIWRHRGTVN